MWRFSLLGDPLQVFTGVAEERPVWVGSEGRGCRAVDGGVKPAVAVARAGEGFSNGGGVDHRFGAAMFDGLGFVYFSALRMAPQTWQPSMRDSVEGSFMSCRHLWAG